MNLSWSYSPETPNSGKSANFCPAWPWDLMDDLKNNRVSLLCYVNPCVSFHSHWWIQTRVTVRKRSILGQIGDFMSRATFKLERWPRKTIGHFFDATASFVHNFVVMCEFKLELRSENAQIGSKFVLFWLLWPWPLTSDIDLLHEHRFCQW